MAFSIFRIVGFLIGLVFAQLVALKLLFSILRNPFAAFRRKRRTTPPEGWLNDVWTHEFVSLKDIRIHVVSAGKKENPLMLFVHGFPECWYSWRHQLLEFAKDYRVVAIDNRGYGDSSKPDEVSEYFIHTLTDDVKDIIDALGYKKCTLVGHDWGGAIVWQFAAKYPEKLSHLIVMNCPHFLVFFPFLTSHWRQFLKSWYMFFFQVPYIPELMMRLHDMEFLGLFRTKASGLKVGEFTHQDVDNFKYSFRDGNFSGPVNYYRAMFENAGKFIGGKRGGATPSGGSSRSALINQTPTLLIWGEQDMALSKEMAVWSGQYVSDFTLKFLPECSHWVQQDDPLQVNTFMREFLLARPPTD